MCVENFLVGVWGASCSMCIENHMIGIRADYTMVTKRGWGAGGEA